MSSTASIGSTSKSAGTSSALSSTGNKSSQNLLLNGSPTNSDSEGEDTKPEKDDSDDDGGKGRSSPSVNTRQSKRKRGRPPKDKHGNKSEQGNTTSGKNSKSGNGTDPYDFDDDGNDPSESAGENTTSVDENKLNSCKKNQWRVDGSGNLLQLNETITKSEMEVDEEQEDGDIMGKEMPDKVSYCFIIFS